MAVPPGAFEGEDAPTHEELLLAQYSELADGVRLRIQTQSRRVLGGVTAIGAVVGYALLRDTPLVVAVIPFVIGLLFVESVIANNEVMILARHMIEIETELSEPGSAFRFEIRRGGAFGRNRGATAFHAVTLEFPHHVRVVTLAAIYLLSVVVSVRVVSAFGPPSVSGVPVAGLPAWVAYGVFSALLAAVGASHMIQRRSLLREVRSAVDEDG